MDCRQARQLFNSYLDGELSGTLKTELGAHRLHCADCRRELALLEVAGHIITSDREPDGVLDDAFTSRLLACMPNKRMNWVSRYRHALYIAVPLAAAAVITLAFVGPWSNRGGKVAGKIVVADKNLLDAWAHESSAPTAAAPTNQEQVDARAKELDHLFEQMKENLSAKQQAGESVQQFFDLSIIQLLNIVKPSNASESPHADNPSEVSAPEEDVIDDSDAPDDAVEDL